MHLRMHVVEKRRGNNHKNNDMSILKEDIIDCGGSHFIHGLNSGYRSDTINGKTSIMNFYNVLVCDSQDISAATWMVWDRVWKDTEVADKKRILLFGYSSTLLESFEYAKIIVSNTDNYHSEVFEFEELIKKIIDVKPQ